ncbi:MAG: hypothetical protein EOO12_12120 [Chitinophagaceae bacterium]|nr:MAG: hypothetical protein EOO12_12120 [Chitinophagaceae bacterium]
MNPLLTRFQEAARRYGLGCPGPEILKTGVLGLDAAKRRLLWLFEPATGAPREQVIALDALSACSIRKDYSGIRPGSLPARRLDEYLLRTYLHLEGSTAADSAEIPFYDSKWNLYRDAAPAERTARHWAGLIAPLLEPTTRRA